MSYEEEDTCNYPSSSSFLMVAGVTCTRRKLVLLGMRVCREKGGEGGKEGEREREKREKSERESAREKRDNDEKVKET
jgi:hypothetical protein